MTLAVPGNPSHDDAIRATALGPNGESVRRFFAGLATLRADAWRAALDETGADDAEPRRTAKVAAVRIATSSGMLRELDRVHGLARRIAADRTHEPLDGVVATRVDAAAWAGAAVLLWHSLSIGTRDRLYLPFSGVLPIHVVLGRARRSGPVRRRAR